MTTISRPTLVGHLIGELAPLEGISRRDQAPWEGIGRRNLALGSLALSVSISHPGSRCPSWHCPTGLVRRDVMARVWELLSRNVAKLPKSSSLVDIVIVALATIFKSVPGQSPVY